MIRNSDDIRRDILKILRKGTVDSYFQLSNLVKTGYVTVKKNCEAMQKFGFVEIEKVPKDKSPSKKDSFRISITEEGVRFLEKIGE